MGLLSVPLCLRQVWAADYWWQLGTGRWVLENGWPGVDVFSYTAAGRPWIELRWLWCVLQSVISDRLGVEALGLVVWLAVVAAFSCAAWPFIHGAGSAVAALVVAIGLLASSERLLARPEIVTFVMLAAFAAVLHRYRARRTPWIWLLPAAQIVWTNAHTLFIFGPLLVGLAAVLEGAAALPLRPAARSWLRGSSGADAEWKRGELVAVACATTLATLVNPWGLRGALFPFELFGEIRGESIFNRVVEEFQSPFELGAITTGTGFWIALVVIALISAILNARRIDPFWAALTAAQLYLSLLAVRNIPLFALSAVSFVLSNVELAWPALGARARRRLTFERIAAVATVALAVGFGWAAATDRQEIVARGGARFGLGIAEHRFPFAATELLDRTGFEGHVLSTMREGSFLVAHGRPVFIDPRLEVYGEEQLRRYVAVQQQPARFLEAVREFEVQALLVDLQSNLVRIAAEQPDWALVHFDTAAVLFVRRGALGTMAAIEGDAALEQAIQGVRRMLPRPPPAASRSLLGRAIPAQPFLALADFLLMLERPALAEPFLEDALAAAPRLSGIELRRATLAELRRDWEGAIAAARAGLEREPNDERLATKLGQALYRTGRFAEARPWLEKSVEARPDRAATRAMLGSVLAAADEFELAEAQLVEAVKLDPTRGDYLANLARVQARRGAIDQAIEGLLRAAELAPADATLARDLAVLFTRTGDPARARVWIERGLALAPGDPTLLQLREASR